MSARILVIEDNPVNLYLMTYLLREHGHEIHSAEDGASGLTMAAELVPDIILCDVQMPGLDGYEVAQRMKQNTSLRNIPLIAVTAHAMLEDQRRILDAGFDGYFTKPIDPETFVQDLAAYLPEASQVSSTAAARVMETQPSPTPTILVVDNEPINLLLASNIFESAGFRVIHAHGLQQGIAMAKVSRPDLILSDICMGDGDGFAFIEAVKADPALQNIPFVFNTSTMITEEARDRALALGASKFLTRPMEPGDVLREIKDCLNRP